jgi:hypothetical protein
MSNLWKKTIVIGILALLFGMTLGPTISSTSTSGENKQTTVTETNLFRNYQQDETILENYGLFQNNFQSFISEIRVQENNFMDLEDLLDWLRNRSEYPILTFLLSRMMNTEKLQNRDIVLSMGWTYDFNPLKKTEVKIVKPVSLWMYKEKSEKISVPSMTVLISADPVSIETIAGNQIGFMFGFRGIYGHIPQQFPKQSMTYMMGTAQNVAALELPTMNLRAS